MASIPPRSEADSDEMRLPWLAGKGPAAATLGASYLGGTGVRWFVSLLILALVSAGAFVLGRGSEKPLAPVAVSLSPAPPVTAQSAPIGVRAPTATTPPALARVAEEPHAATQGARAAPPPASDTGLHLRTDQIRAVRKIVREARVKVHRGETARVAVATLPRLGLPGRVVQLGAYRNVRDAEAAATLFRFKYRGLLAPLAKGVLPFRPKGTRKLFYRVQFVTPSQAYSEVTCQRLRAAAKTCIVVY